MGLKKKQKWLQLIWQGAAISLFAVIVGLFVNQLRPNNLPIFADWSPKARLASNTRRHIMISLDKAKELFLAQTAIFLDARSQELYERGHIKGAHSLPYANFNERFSDVMGDIPLYSKIVAYCDGESCGESYMLALDLELKGYKNIWVLVNGLTAWQQAHLPIEKGPSPTSM